jgi:uncharacterized protein (DUF1697 family)
VSAGRVALLRSINVGGGGRLVMADLRATAGRLGLTEGRTIVQTGNLVLPADGRTAEALESDLERALADDLGMKNDVMVREAAEWAAIVASNPFPEAAAVRPARLVLMALKRPPGPGALADLAHPGPERIAAGERHLYIDYLEGIGTSRLTGAWIERRLGMRGTARNWNTVLKIAAALAVPG